jgi:serine/threonine protein kinase
MEFLSKTLKQKISSKLLVKEQKAIMKQLMLALLEMKNRNIIHRDLKP